MASLFVITGEQVDYYPLGQRTMVVGRDEAASIQVVDKRMSRKHVQIRYDRQGDYYVALDMKSRNGTFINGQRVKDEWILGDGDQMTIGDTQVLFSIKEFPNHENAMKHFKQAGQRRFTTFIDMD